jgi:LysR family cys regulon transcriptional activator
MAGGGADVKLQHLITANAVVKHDLNLTRAAVSLNTSQPALSMHLQALEAELRTPLFLRQRNRLVGLSPAGEALLPIAARAVDVVEELKRAAQRFQVANPAVLTIAASQTVARCFLPALVQRFSRNHPKVKLRVRHGPLSQLVELVVSGEADFSISTKPGQATADLLCFPCYEMDWLLVAQPSHPLLQRATLTLADLADQPIVTYDETFASHGVAMRAFRGEGLSPNIVLTEADTEIMKRYVRSGIGIALVKDGAFDAEHDSGLAARSLRGVLPATPIALGTRVNAPVSRTALNFIELIRRGLAGEVRQRLAAPYR